MLKTLIKNKYDWITDRSKNVKKKYMKLLLFITISIKIKVYFIRKINNFICENKKIL